MKQRILAVFISLSLCGCCGFLEAGPDLVRNELSALKVGVSRKEAIEILNRHHFFCQEQLHAVDATRDGAPCPARKRLFRCVVIFDSDDRVDVVEVFDINIPI